MNKRGFTAFFAVLVSSLALAVGLAIYDLLSREIALTQTSLQSQYAIFAADTGSECALYWDQQFKDGSGNPLNGGAPSAFATSSADTQEAAVGSGRTCNQLDITSNTFNASITGNSGNGWYVYPSPNGGATFATTTFFVSMGTVDTAPCAMVEVGKSGDPPRTLIISHGYNTCSSVGAARIERRLQISF